MSRYLNSMRLMRSKTSSKDLTLPKHVSSDYDDAPVPRLTIHSFIMGVFVSMGGFIFGYDTGQISGFLVC